MKQSQAESTWWYLQFRKQKGVPRTKSMEAKVVGVTYENRQTIIADLIVNEQLVLQREPDNPHDSQAIAVCRQNGQKIGYLARGLASQLSPSLDTLGRPLPATVIAVVGKGSIDYRLGVRIRFTPPEQTGLQSVAELDPEDFEHM